MAHENVRRFLLGAIEEMLEESGKRRNEGNRLKNRADEFFAAAKEAEEFAASMREAIDKLESE